MFVDTLDVRGAAMSDYELLRGGSDLLDVALLAARGSAVARRLAQGAPIDADDERSLLSIIQLLEASAASVKSFASGPVASPPSGALAARADVAIEAVLHGADPSTDVEALASIFENLAGRLRDLVQTHDAEIAATLVDLLAGLATTILRETGHVGESTSQL